MTILIYLLGVITIPVGYLLFALIIQGAAKDVGYGPCDFCNHYGGKEGHDIGEVRHYRYWIAKTVHARFWARLKKHRKARGDKWREDTARGWQTWGWSDRHML